MQQLLVLCGSLDVYVLSYQKARIWQNGFKTPIERKRGKKKEFGLTNVEQVGVIVNICLIEALPPMQEPYFVKCFALMLGMRILRHIF